MGKNNSADFMDFGTFEPTDSGILKSELEKKGITVKLLFPGTNISPDTYGKASFSALTILIEGKDFNFAKELCEKLGIKPIKKIKSVSKLSRYFIIFFVAILALIILITVFID